MTNYLCGTLALILVACGSEGDLTPSRTDAGDDAAAHLRGIISHRTLGRTSDQPLADVEVCALGDVVVCGSSDGNGMYELTTPRQDVLKRVRFAKTGFVSVVVEHLPDSPPSHDVFMLSEHDASEFAASAGSIEWGELGGVVLAAHLATFQDVVPLPGLSARLSGGPEFLYPDASNRPNSALKATSVAGWAIAMGVPPESIDLEFAPPYPEAKCSTAPRSVSERSVALELMAGHLLLAEVYCFY